LDNTHLGNNEVKDAFIFSCFTGLRYSDILNLKWQNIINNKIEFRQQKTGGVEYLPLSQTAKKILETKLPYRKDEFVFHLPQKPVIWEHIKNWVKKAEINKRVSFHTARHTFATLSLTMGTDLYTVSKLLGHKSISTTQVYAKIVDAKKVEAINKLPKL
jgi:integrase